MKKVIVVTGGTSGIGEATSRLVATNESVVVLLGRNSTKGEKIVDDIRAQGNDAIFFQTDITIERDLVAARDFIKTKFGYVDVLVNNAGVMLDSKELERLPEAEWDYTFEVNIKAVFRIVSLFKELLMKTQGCIVNNASIAGMHSYISGRSYAYSASKAALIQFSRQMALNYACDGVRVNCVCPGIIDTDILGNRDREKYVQRVPLGYLGKPIDVANVISFLISDKAKYVTGAVITVDGGASLK